jgi:hypothetical protein
MRRGNAVAAPGPEAYGQAMRLLAAAGAAGIPLGIVLDRQGAVMAGVMALSSVVSFLVADRRLARRRRPEDPGKQDPPTGEGDPPDGPPPPEGPHDFQLRG